MCFSSLFGVYQWSPYCLALLPISNIRLTEARKQFSKNTTLTLKTFKKKTSKMDMKTVSYWILRYMKVKKCITGGFVYRSKFSWLHHKLQGIPAIKTIREHLPVKLMNRPKRSDGRKSVETIQNVLCLVPQCPPARVILFLHIFLGLHSPTFSVFMPVSE